MGTKSKYSDEQLISAVATSVNYRMVLRHLGLFESGGSYRQLKIRISRVGCDTSHFTGASPMPTRPRSTRRIADILVENFQGNTPNVKRRLIDAGVLENICENGHAAVWMGEKLVLHLDHKNGINTDFRLENLRLLCPNCHSQTATYCRGIRRKIEHKCSCGAPKARRSKLCRKCDTENKRGIYPYALERENLSRGV